MPLDGWDAATPKGRRRRRICIGVVCLLSIGALVGLKVYDLLSEEARTVIGKLLTRPLRTLYSCNGWTSRSACHAMPPLLAAYIPRTVIHLAHERQTWRYFSAFPCSGGIEPAVCLAFKNHRDESWVGVLRAEDGYAFGGEPNLMLPSPWRVPGVGPVDTHTLGVLSMRAFGADTPPSDYMIVGGTFRFRSVPGRHQTGVWIARGRAPTFSATPTRAGSSVPRGTQWHDTRIIFNGTHPGCIERRLPRVLRGACEFDGRFSLTQKFNGRHFLYARQNPTEVGSRFVQYVTSEDTLSWSPFAPISIRDYRPSDGDVYFFAAQVSRQPRGVQLAAPRPARIPTLFSAQVNPADPSSLIALAPFVHRGCGCVGIVASRDGAKWSRIFPLLHAETDLSGARSVSHPVAGLVRRGETIVMYFHLHVWLSNAIADMKGLVKEHDPFPDRRVVAYTIPLETFGNWTRRMLDAV